VNAVLVWIFRLTAAGEVGVSKVVGVDLHKAVFDEERYVPSGELGNASYGVVDEHRVGAGHVLDGFNPLEFPRLAVLEAVDQGIAGTDCLKSGEALGGEDQAWETPRVEPLGDLFLCGVVSIVFVEADVVRAHSFGLPDVPFAGEQREVAGVTEKPGQADFFGPWVLRDLVTGEDGPGEPGPDRQATGEDGRTGGCAGLLGIAGREFESLLGEAVDVGRGGARNGAAAVTAGVAVAHVVNDNPDDVGLFTGLPPELSQSVGNCFVLFGTGDDGLEVLRRSDGAVKGRSLLGLEDAGGNEHCQYDQQAGNETFIVSHQVNSFLIGVSVRISGRQKTRWARSPGRSPRR